MRDGQEVGSSCWEVGGLICAAGFGRAHAHASRRGKGLLRTGAGLCVQTVAGLGCERWNGWVLGVLRCGWEGLRGRGGAVGDGVGSEMGDGGTVLDGGMG